MIDLETKKHEIQAPNVERHGPQTSNSRYFIYFEGKVKYNRGFRSLAHFEMWLAEISLRHEIQVVEREEYSWRFTDEIGQRQLVDRRGNPIR